MRIAIIGSREFSKPQMISHFFDSEVKDDDIIISGGARGPDSIAESMAKNRGIKTIIFHAEWDKYNKKAGFIRNEKIIHEAERVVAFWDGKSRGTAHSIDLSRKNNKHLTIYLDSAEASPFDNLQG